MQQLEHSKKSVEENETLQEKYRKPNTKHRAFTVPLDGHMVLEQGR